MRDGELWCGAGPDKQTGCGGRHRMLALLFVLVVTVEVMMLMPWDIAGWGFFAEDPPKWDGASGAAADGVHVFDWRETRVARGGTGLVDGARNDAPERSGTIGGPGTPVMMLTSAVLYEECRKVAGAFESLGEALNDRGWHDPNPKSLPCSQIIRAVSSWFDQGKWDVRSLRRLGAFVQKLQRGEEVTLVVIGGSFSFGSRDKEQRTYQKGTWTGKLDSLLKVLWPKAKVNVVNLSRGGFACKDWLTAISLVRRIKYDLVIGEWSINDQAYTEGWYFGRDAMAARANATAHDIFPLLLDKERAPAVLVLELFKVAAKKVSEASLQCGQAKPPEDDPELAFSKELTDINGHKVAWCHQWLAPQDWRSSARRRWAVPMVSYRDAVVPNIHKPPRNISVVWSGNSHPGGLVHAWIAECVAFALYILRKMPTSVEGSAVRAKREAPKVQYTAKDTCYENVASLLTSMNDTAGQKVFPVLQNHSRGCAWRFMDDRPSRVPSAPGWVMLLQRKDLPDSCKRGTSLQDAATLDIPILQGPRGLVHIQHIISHSSPRLRPARLWIDDDPENSLEIHPEISERFEVVNSTMLRIGGPKVGAKSVLHVQIFNLLRDHRNRFKILNVISC